MSLPILSQTALQGGFSPGPVAGTVGGPPLGAAVFLGVFLTALFVLTTLGVLEVRDARRRTRKSSLRRGRLPKPMMALRLWEPEQPARAVRVHKLPIILGRGPDCHLKLKDPGISRRHARILRKSTGYVLQDLGSERGILFGRTPTRATRLRRGAVYRLAQTKLMCLF